MAVGLVEEWRQRLPLHGYLDLTDDLAQFPELRDAVRPPRFDLRPLESCYVAAEGEEDLAVELRVELLPPSNLPVVPHAQGWAHIELATVDAVMAIHTLDIPAGIQAGGLGRLVIAQLADLGDQLGLEALEMEAGKIGRWAWMCCGFDFMDEDARELVVDAAARFAARLNRDVDLDSIEHSWDFLALRDSVGQDEISAAGGPKISPPGKPVPLGKALLLGPAENENAWYGRLTLDPQSPGRVRLESYV